MRANQRAPDLTTRQPETPFDAEAADQQLASMVAVRDSLQAQETACERERQTIVSQTVGYSGC